jgi:hypothetical protein
MGAGAVTAFERRPQRQLAYFAGVPAQAADRRRAEDADAQEFQQIRKFVAACRRQWPGAMVVLRPDDAPVGAGAPITTQPAPGDKPHG